jgi:CO/xanthine dehydrogenase Mo-binding subunit
MVDEALDHRAYCFNAVWHATGVRVRKFPITLDRLIEPQEN